jgi:hypothetical protein
MQSVRGLGGEMEEALTVISSFLAASTAANCSKRAHKEVDVLGSVILLGKLGAGDIRKTVLMGTLHN